jgi:CheY-like chemotaxis protein
MSNAVKFTPDEGTISFEASLADEKDDVVTIRFKISDSGIGISEQQQARLFTAFQQAEDSTTRKFGGTGLGLSISKSIVDLMDGRIWVESKLKEGASFFFTIQVKRGKDKDPEKTIASYENETQGRISIDLGGHTILLAEDIDINQEIVLALLEPTGLRIECADNGAQAVQLFSEAPEKYDLIFMDVQMPEMDGYEATRMIRKMDLPGAKTIPIIAMTANVFREDVDNCLKAGMDGHVGKPLVSDEVIKLLRFYMKT